MNERQALDQRVVDDFRARGRKTGGPFADFPLLVLHHTGAKSGTAYTSPLAFLPDGDNWVVFAANGADAYSIELTSTPGQYEQSSGDPAPGALLYQVDSATACTGALCSFVVPDTLAPSTVYQWRVEGFLLGAPGTWSNHNGSDWSFTTLSQ